MLTATHLHTSMASGDSSSNMCLAAAATCEAAVTTAAWHWWPKPPTWTQRESAPSSAACRNKYLHARQDISKSMSEQRTWTQRESAPSSAACCGSCGPR